MSFLSRLFGPKQSSCASPEAIRQAVASMIAYLQSVVDHYGEAKFQSSVQAQQILAIYSFGGVSALAMEHHLNQPEAHALCLTVFTKFFGFTLEDCANKAEAVITAAPDPSSPLYAIIHRGLDGFLHWQKNLDDGAARDYGEIMAQVTATPNEG